MFHMGYKWEVFDQASTPVLIKKGSVEATSVNMAKNLSISKVKDISSEWSAWTMDRHPIEGDTVYICHSLKTSHILTLISIPI